MTGVYCILYCDLQGCSGKSLLLLLFLLLSPLSPSLSPSLFLPLFLLFLFLLLFCSLPPALVLFLFLFVATPVTTNSAGSKIPILALENNSRKKGLPVGKYSSPMDSLPGPSNRSPPATFKSPKATRGDLLEVARLPGCVTHSPLREKKTQTYPNKDSWMGNASFKMQNAEG